MSRRIAIAGLSFMAAIVFAVSVSTNPAGAQDLGGSWRLDEGSGYVTADHGPFLLDGSWTAPGGPTWIAGVEGAGLRFDSDDEVVLPDHPALEPARITVAAWVRRTGSPGAYRYVFSKGASSCTRSAYGLYTGEDGGAAFYVAGDGAFTVSSQAPARAVWDGRWHRLMGSYDGTNVRLYLDGEQVGIGTPGPTHIDYGLESRSAFIGSYRGGCELPFDGDIDGVALWRAPLTAAQARADARPPVETPASGPIGPAPGGAGGLGSAAEGGFTVTPEGCTSIRLSPRIVRAARRTRLVATVRRGAKQASGTRVVMRSGRRRAMARTDSGGRVRFIVKPHHRYRRVTVRAAVATPRSCGKPVAYARVRAPAR